MSEAEPNPVGQTPRRSMILLRAKVPDVGALVADEIPDLPDGTAFGS